MKRRQTRAVKVGGVQIGDGAPIAIQSMTTTESSDVDATVKQIRQLEEAGCELIRVSANSMEAAKALGEIKKRISIPLVADIHFDYRMALEAAKHVDKLRINPGNIGGPDKVKAVVAAAKQYGLPIRIGVNLGSLERDLFMKYGYSAHAMLLSAERHIKMLKDENFHDIIVSLKASDVPRMVEAYRLFSAKYDYPVHLGVTEAGSLIPGTVKSSMGMGILLSEGIGDSIRVSLSADPIEEVRVAKHILRSLGLRKQGVEVTSCPTCARTEVDVIKLVEDIESITEHIKKPIKIAIMGCAVNGPGESMKSDLGIVGAPGNHLLYKNGKVAGRVADGDVKETLLREIKILSEQN